MVKKKLIKSIIVYSIIGTIVFGTPASFVYAEEGSSESTEETENPEQEAEIVTTDETSEQIDEVENNNDYDGDESGDSFDIESTEEELFDANNDWTWSDDYNYEYTEIDSDSIEITKYRGEAEEVIVPSTIDGYNVVSIGEAAFSYNRKIKKVTISEGITTIKLAAFKDADYLNEVDLPNSLVTIGPAAFSDCQRLATIEIPESVTTIGVNAFNSCSSLKEIVIPDSVTDIGLGAFYECKKLENVILSQNITGINESTFENCYLLKEIEIPENVKTIGVNAFSCCKGLETLSISEGVTKIGEDAFCGCISLNNVTIPNSVTDIGAYAFVGCKSLEKIIIPSNVKALRIGAFANCKNLQEVIIEEGITEITYNVFYECGMKKVTIPRSITYIEQDAFYLPAGGECDIFYAGSQTQWNTISYRSNWYGFHMHFNLECVDINLNKTSAVYNGKTNLPTVTAKDGGIILAKDTDYKISYKDSYGNTVFAPKDVGEYTVVVTGKGKYAGKITKKYTIKPKAITPTVTLSGKSYEYNGKVRKPICTVKDGTTTLTSDDYTVKYKTNKDVGRAYVAVTLKGNYSGSKNASFVINPKGTTLTTVTAASKAFTAKWTKQSEKMSTSYITGYQIQYATDKAFSKNKKTLTLKGYSTTGKKITGLNAKTTYFVRIRTYKTVNGTNYYSKWSGAKTVKTK